MGKFDLIKLSIPAKPEYIAVVRLTLSGIANRMGFSYEEIEDLKVALSEAVTNAVTHAYETEEKGEVALGFGVYKDKLELMVADRGISFDIEEIKEHVKPYDNKESIEEMREGGFGLFLMETLMDEVEIIDHQGIIVYMTKYLSGTGVGQDENEVPTSRL